MPTTKRPRGAPPGNINALKHGFYSRQFRKMELDDLEAMLDAGLDSEINMLRVSTRRVLELADGNDDLDTGIKLLTVLGITSTRLANLLRAQVLLGGSRQDDIYKQIIEALDDVLRTFNATEIDSALKRGNLSGIPMAEVPKTLRRGDKVLVAAKPCSLIRPRKASIWGGETGMLLASRW